MVKISLQVGHVSNLIGLKLSFWTCTPAEIRIKLFNLTKKCVSNVKIYNNMVTVFNRNKEK